MGVVRVMRHVGGFWEIFVALSEWDFDDSRDRWFKWNLAHVTHESHDLNFNLTLRRLEETRWKASRYALHTASASTQIPLTPFTNSPHLPSPLYWLSMFMLISLTIPQPFNFSKSYHARPCPWFKCRVLDMRPVGCAPSRIVTFLHSRRRRCWKREKRRSENNARIFFVFGHSLFKA